MAPQARILRLAVAAALACSCAQAVYRLRWISDYVAGAYDTDAAENIAYDPETQYIFVANSAAAAVTVVSIAQPTSPNPARTLAVKGDLEECAAFDSESIQSVAVAAVASYPNRIVAVAAVSADAGVAGYLAFYDAKTFQFLACQKAGVQPEGIASDGRARVACINEGSAADDGSADFPGGMTMCDIGGTATNPTFACTTYEFTAANFQDGAFVDADTFRAAGVRLYGPSSDDVALDVEPEGAVFTEDGEYLFVALQDNNAYAMWDVRAERFLFLRGFGAFEATMDASDSDDAIALRSAWGSEGTKVYNMPMPDQVASFTHDGVYYFVTANEGDTRDGEDMLGVAEAPLEIEGEEIRVGDADPDCASCGADDLLGRLLTTVFMPSSLAADACGSQNCSAQEVSDAAAGLAFATVRGSDAVAPGGVYGIGGRSITVWSWDGAAGEITRVWDSGSDMERVTGGGDVRISEADLCGACRDSPSAGSCAACPFNSDEAPPAFDARSDAKGPEPECVTTGVMPDGTRLVFAGLERTGGIITYDMSDPAAPVLQDFLNVRNWKTADEDRTTFGDTFYLLNDGPESLVFISAQESPIGRPLLAAATPLAGRLSLYLVEEGAMREDDGSCSRTAKCPYIQEAEGGTGAAFRPLCDIIEDAAIRADFDCAVDDGGDDDDDGLSDGEIAAIVICVLLFVVGCGVAYACYARGKKTGYSLATAQGDHDGDGNGKL